MASRTLLVMAAVLVLPGPGFAQNAPARDGAVERNQFLSIAAAGKAADLPIVDWSVPQFLGPSGVATSMETAHVGSAKSDLKTERDLSVFTAITPCRLVDTRNPTNQFAPAILSPEGAFTAGETRSYSVAGLCGLPATSKGIRAISIAITTLPSPVSGDVETVPGDVSPGSTVDMVVQANEWNSVSKVVRLDATGTFKLQMRITFGHVAIDVNGYYIDTSTPTTDDFYAIKGSYAVASGGLLYSENESAAGAAIRGRNSGTGSDVLLANGSNAIDIISGQLRVRTGGAFGTSTPAFIHQVAAGNLCVDSRYTLLDEAHVSPPNASAGQMMFVQEASHSGATNESTPKGIRTIFRNSFSCDGSTTLSDSWYLFSDATFSVGETYDVLLINP